MSNKKPEPIIESIFETENRLRRSAKFVLKEVKKMEFDKLKNSYHWVTLNDKTKVLRKINK
jgi:hypothetical protein